MYSESPSSNAAMLLCRDCGVLHPLPSNYGSVDPEAIEDLEQFRTHHREHTLERAMRLPDPVLHDRPAWDPMARVWFRVAVGEHAMFVCSSRTSIDEPRHHEVCHAPPAYCLRTEVDESLLRRALEQHFFPNRVPHEQINAFVAAARRLFAAADASGIETSYDDPQLPNAEIGPCPVDLRLRLRDAAAAVFHDEWERDHTLAFVEANGDEYGAFAIRVLRELVPSA